MEASRVTTGQQTWPLAGARQVLSDYVELTKPRVQSLLLLTTITTMYVAGDPSLGLVALTCLGGSLSAGADRAACGARVRRDAGGAVVRADGADRQRPERGARGGRLPRLRVRLHGVAE